jgi:hypothetical protein
MNARHSAYIDYYDDQFIYFMNCYCLLGCWLLAPQFECLKVSTGYLWCNPIVHDEYSNTYSCLKDLHYNLKDNTSKKTWCHVCNERTNVKDIFQWECRIVFYCSRECAKSHGRDMRVNVRNTGCTQCTIQAKNSENGSADDSYCVKCARSKCG